MRERLGLGLSKGMKTIEAIGGSVLGLKDSEDDRKKSEIKICCKPSDCWFETENSLFIETFYILYFLKF